MVSVYFGAAIGDKNSNYRDHVSSLLLSFYRKKCQILKKNGGGMGWYLECDKEARKINCYDRRYSKIR